ncbi:MAG TPA: cation:proton antiporter [Rhodospirillales bacterium]|jgi:CPA2 family monovalent cation:H+ antiporter-2
MADKSAIGTVGSSVESAAEAVGDAVKGAAEAVGEAVGGAVVTAAHVAQETALQSNLTGIAIVVLAALVCGMSMERFRQPAIVGYILAGVLLGPSALAVVESRASIDVLAELGVLMLLFLIGMELSLRLFRRIWVLGLLVTTFQVAASVGVMVLLSMALGWPLGLAVLLGFVVALSSTAVAIKILEGIGELHTRAGRISIGVLIAQDLAVVPMMLVIGAMGGGGFDWIALPKILVAMLLLVALILYLGGRKVGLPFGRIVEGHQDLKPLTALAFCFGCAALSGLLGLSAAYGAFIAGLVIGNSRQRHAMLDATRPIQSVLMMVFFLSVGLLIDLDYIWANLGVVLLVFFVVAVFKTALNVGFLGLIGQPWHHAFVAGICLAQIGEFSFLLSVVGADAGVISREDHRLVVAVTALSLALSPLWVVTGRRFRVLAEHGITSGTELLKLVYEPETEFVTSTLDKASSKSMRGLRAAALWLRSQRQRRQGAGQRADKGDGAAPPGKSADVEIIPPGTPAGAADAVASRGNGKNRPDAAPGDRRPDA